MAGALGDLVVALHADTAKFTSDMGRASHIAERDFARMTRNAVMAGTALGIVLYDVGKAALRFTGDLFTAAAKLDDMAESTGASVEELSRFEQQARISGTSIDVVEGALVKLAKGLNANDEEAKKATRALDALGLKAADLKNIDPATAFRLIAAELNKFADGGGKTALMLDLLGKNAAAVLPFMKDLANDADIAANTTKEQAAQAEALGKAWQRLMLDARNLGQAVALDALPMLIGLIKEFKGTETGAAEAGREFSVLKETMRTLAILGVNVAYVFNTIGIAAVGVKAQIEGFAAGGVEGFKKQREMLKQILADERKAFDEREARIINLGKIPVIAPPPPPQTKPLDYKASPDKAAINKAIKDAEAAQRALNDLTEAGAKITVDTEKAAAANRLAILDSFYKAGFLSESNYWTGRAQIQKNAYDAERAALDANISSRQKAADDLAPKGKAKGSKEYFDALKDLAEAQAKRNSLDAAFNAQGDADLRVKEQATKDYERAIKLVNIQLDEMNGRTEEAAAARLALQNAPLRAEAEQRDNLEDQIAITKSERGAAAQEKFNALRKKAEVITARLGLEEERIQNSQRVGAISELSSLKTLSTRRQEAGAQLRVIGVEMERIGESSGLDNLILDAEKFNVSLETLASQANLLEDKFKKVFEDVFTDEFTKVITGTQSVTKAFKNMVSSILTEMVKIQARQTAQGLVKGSGGFFSKLFEGFFGGSGLVAEAVPGQFSLTNPAYGAAGGLLKGPAHSAGGVSLEAEGGEYLTSKERTAKWLPLLKAINSGKLDSFVGSFEKGGYVPRTGLAMVHQGEEIVPANERREEGIVINQNLTFGSDVNSSTMGVWARRIKNETMSAVADSTRRGGGFSRAVRG